MPSIEIPNMVDESKGQHVVENSNGVSGNNSDAHSSPECDEKPANGGGDVVPDDNDDDSSVPEHWLKNKKIDPKKAKPSREPLKKVFVGGIDPEVESLDLPYDTQKGKRKHYIFVSFSTEAAAKKAISKERQEIFGRQCDVRVAVTRDQASRQKGYTYGEYASAYPGFDPFAYNYYGYDYYGTAAAAAAASGYGK
ncbi:unnamed protein product [Trichobilharzia regenti]|nr:unnamed protein product [Trichobilharzia regenti]